MSDSIKHITEIIGVFRDERDWKQFHTPKDLASAISIEAGELLEQFLWKTNDEVFDRIETHREKIEEEIADIGIFLFELAGNLDMDLGEIMLKKVQKNAIKYPVEKAKGKHTKYTEL